MSRARDFTRVINLKKFVMRTFNLNGIEVLSIRELICVKGGGEEGIPVPIIIVEEGFAASSVSSASANAISVLVAVNTVKETKKKK
jgi:hypothetical protein